MSNAQRTTPAAATPNSTAAPLIPVLQPRELAALGELLDACENAQIRLYLAPAPDGRLLADGPRGAMTPDLRAMIAGHKGALVRALRAAGAIGGEDGGPPVPTARGACHEATHPRPPDYSYTLGRWLCVTCEPDVYALFVRAVARAYDAPIRARREGYALDGNALATPAPVRLDRGPLMRELLAWGEGHDWPPLPYAWRTGAGDDHRPYKAIMAGAAGWRRFVAGNTSAELLAAERAAAAYPATPSPDDPMPSTPAPAPRVENNPRPAQCVVCGGPIAACQGQRVDAPGAGSELSEYGAAFRHPGCPEPAPTPAPDPTSNAAPSSPTSNAAPDASNASKQDPTLDTGAQEHTEDTEGAPRDWPDVFAVLDAGAVYLSRIGAHSEAGAVERVELDDLTRPDPSSASAARLLAYMVRERITQLWIHPAWAAAVGLPMRELGDPRKMHDGIAHPFAGEAGEWATDDSPAGTWGVMGHAGHLAPWMKFYRKGEAGTIAISVPHLDGRVPWREAQDARELLAAIIAYRAALRGYAYRSGPGATSTALLRVVHRGSSAALDLAASMAPADFPAPARVPGLMPQWGWIRERTAEECERGRYVIGLDKNGMFLAASSSLRLGLDARPVHLDTADPALAAAVEALTDMHSRPRPKRPVGYWLARVTFPAGSSTPAPSPLLPHPCYTAPGQPDPAAFWQWYVSATLELCAELGAHVEVREAHLWPRESVHEPLEPWYQRLRDARAELMRERADPAGAHPGAALALAAVKATYTQGIGWLDASWLRKSEAPADLYRPDWRHAIHGTANANLWRNLARGLAASGGRRAPFAILTDAAYYLTDNPDPLALAAELGLRMGEGLGQYKVKLDALDAAKLAPVWELLDTGRERGRVVSEFASIANGSEG